jgi:5,10-methylenetetrahydromethanopterin reductase
MPAKPPQRPISLSPRFSLATDLTERARIADELGVDQIWLAQLPDQRDATIMAASCLHSAPSATVGTAVLPIYARHPVSTTQAALTLSEFSGGRFALGLGVSHLFINEYVLGYQPGPPIAAMREYLRIVKDLIDDGSATREGKYFTGRARYAPARTPLPLFLAALRPQMIRLAVKHCDGILLWLCTPRYIKERVTPVVAKACAEFGKDPGEFQVLTLVPAYVTEDPGQAYDLALQQMKSYRLLPYYRYVLEAYGDIDPTELNMFGTKDHIRARMEVYREAGTTPVIAPFSEDIGEFADTITAAFEL